MKVLGIHIGHFKPSNWSLLKFSWDIIKLQKHFFILLASLSSCVYAADTLIWPYVIRLLTDVFTVFDGNRELAIKALSKPIGFGVSFWVLCEIFFRVEGYLLASIKPKFESNVRMTMFEFIQKHQPQYFNERLAGVLANKIGDITSHLSIILEILLRTLFPYLITIIFSIAIFSRINPFFAKTLICWVGFHILTSLFFARKCNHKESIHSESRSLLMGKILDSLNNNFNVNLFYKFRREKLYVLHYQKEERAKHQASMWYVEKVRLILGIGVFFAGGLGINGMMLYYWIQGTITSGTALQIFSICWAIETVLRTISMTLPNLFQSIGIAKQALTLLSEDKWRINESIKAPLKVTRGKIHLKNVSFSYDQKPLFNTLDLEIAPNEKIGFVGYSGSGKSTAVKLILGMHQPQKGEVLVDDQNIQSYSLESLRKQIALIPQDITLFHRTIRENILYGCDNYTDEALKKACQIANCDTFIEELSDGYDTVVGERGAKLSGGERQRIAIARAILAKPKIFILDEATSSLDSITENCIQESLDYVIKASTFIAIAHRLSTVIKMDRIYVFNQGKIVEQGSHEELLVLGGLYKEMWVTQTQGFLPKDRCLKGEVYSLEQREGLHETLQ